MARLTLGIAGILLKLDRGESFTIEEMFAGFNDFGRPLLAGIIDLPLHISVESAAVHPRDRGRSEL
ncbi:MAG: hypothetical protein LRZ88_02835 [Candidatus Cloacimonetes bacterium]|nr:hypothetical protein [Candidatus Cloacimonadota bacterium]